MSAGRVVPAGEGREVRVGPNVLRVKAGPEVGHTLVGVFESAMPPGGGFPFAHVHDEYEEVFYVLEGEIEYRLGEVWAPHPPGARSACHVASSTASVTPARIPHGTWSCTLQLRRWRRSRRSDRLRGTSGTPYSPDISPDSSMADVAS